MAEKLRIGLVGCGRISRSLYVKLLTGFADRAQVVAVCDALEERALERAEQFRSTYEQVAAESRGRAATATGEARDKAAAVAEGAAAAASVPLRVYSRLDEFVRSDDFSTVVVTTQPLAHPVASIAALEGKKHVFTEGPMAANLRDADAMIDASRHNGVKLNVQYTTRFFRESEQAKLAITSGRLGRIALGRMDASWFHTMDTYFNKDAWRGNWAGEGGGSVFHHGRYCSDLYLHLMGDSLAEIAAFTGTFFHQIEVEDASTAALRFANGALGHVTTTTCAHDNPSIPPDRVEILGEKASLSVGRGGNNEFLHIGSRDADYARELRTFLDEAIPPRDEDMQVTQMRRFLDAIQHGGPVPISGESARMHVELVCGTYKSALTRQIVKMPLAPDDPFYGPEGTIGRARAAVGV